MSKKEEILDLWNLAEERIGRLNALNFHLSIAILNDLRLAGRYYLQSSCLQDQKEKLEQEALRACQRAIYSAVEAEILYHVQHLRLFSVDFSSLSLNIPKFDPVMLNRAQREAEKVEQLIYQINQNGLRKEEYYLELKEYCDKLAKTSEYLSDVRPEAEKQKLAEKKKFLSGAASGTIGFLGFVIALLTFLISMNFCGMKKEILPQNLSVQDAGLK
jgi:hypothetical protein